MQHSIKFTTNSGDNGDEHWNQAFKLDVVLPIRGIDGLFQDSVHLSSFHMTPSASSKPCSAAAMFFWLLKFEGTNLVAVGIDMVCSQK